MTPGISRFTFWRYVFALFARAILVMFAISFVLLSLIAVVEAFQESGRRGDVGLGPMLVMALCKAPSMVEMMLPFSVLVGSMGAFLTLSRRNELVVARSIGVSVWQLLVPALLATFLIGTAIVTVYNPFAAFLMEERGRLDAKYLGGKNSLLSSTNAGFWLRQDGVDGQSVLRAARSRQQGQILDDVTFYTYRGNNEFSERIEAERAELKGGSWTLTNAWVISANSQPEFYRSYLVSTYLTREQVQQSIGNPDIVSFWQLPLYILAAERAGVSALLFKLRYQVLLSMPFLLCAMVLIAATVSLKIFRFGNVGMMIVTGMGAGLCLFMANELMRDLGAAGLLSPVVAIWLPVLTTSLAAVTILLYQEDG